jgi:undecaprenyl-diphosphatase
VNVFYAIILGIIQGLTEFLPVSSTAHLTLAGKAFGLIDPAAPENWTAFIAVMQLGTVLAVILYFLEDLLRMARSILADLRSRGPQGAGRAWSADSHLAGKIIAGTIPVAVIGIGFKKIIEGMFTKEITTIATSMVVVALLLLWAEKVGKRVRTESGTTWKDALVIGTAQACALIPGSSRSGTTITAGLFLGMTRETAARFSFLLSIPAVLASGFFEFYEARHYLSGAEIVPLVVSTATAALSGYAVLRFFLRYLKTHSMYVFVYYRVILGLLLWGLFLAKVV